MKIFIKQLTLIRSMHTRWSCQLAVRLGPLVILPRNTLPSATNEQEEKNDQYTWLKLRIHERHLSLLRVNLTALLLKIFAHSNESDRMILFLVAKEQQVCRCRNFAMFPLFLTGRWRLQTFPLYVQQRLTVSSSLFFMFPSITNGFFRRKRRCLIATGLRIEEQAIFF